MLNWLRRSGRVFEVKNLRRPVFRSTPALQARLLLPKKSYNFSSSRVSPVPVFLAGFLNLFQKKEEEDESELITTIKRAVLMIQRDEFKLAEQLLHVALKLAQEQQNEDGITYIYDLMANLAFAQGEFNKAEKLFVQTMQRVIAAGAPQDDIKILHMSLKLAKICEEKRKFEEAEVGYEFCVNTVEKKVSQDPRDEDLVTLLAMSLDWYARFLLDKNRLTEAFNCFQKAYDMCIKVNGEIHEQTVVLLNDLGSVSFLKGDHSAAMDYLTKAVEIGKHLPNMNDFSSVYVNLGNVCLHNKMYEEAKKHCKEGKLNATRHNNAEGIQEAMLCLEELSKAVLASGKSRTKTLKLVFVEEEGSMGSEKHLSSITVTWTSKEEGKTSSSMKESREKSSISLV